MNALVLSGGASKGAWTAGVVQHLLREENMTFDLAVGTSTGSLVGGPALLGDHPYLADIYTTVANEDILDNTFLGRILKTPIDASMEPLHVLLKRYYLARGKLNELIQHPGNKQLVVSMVNVKTGNVHFVSSDSVKDGAPNKIRDTTFVKAILASCCEPVFTEPVQVYEDEAGHEFQNDLFYDGGVKEFLPIEHAVQKGADEVWAISTHRLESSETKWGGETSPDKVSVIDALKWTISSLLDEVARGDRYRSSVYLAGGEMETKLDNLVAGSKLTRTEADDIMAPLRKMAVPPSALKHLYLIYPDVSMGTSLDFNERIMIGYLRQGRRAAQAFIAAGKPEFTDATLKPWNHLVIG